GRSEMVFLGMDLSRSATSALSESVVATLPYALLILVVGVSSWFQQRQIRGRNPDAAVNPQMQMMMKVMPFFLPIISFQLDASLVVYFVVSNLYRIGQQAYITRSLYGPNAEATPVVVPKKTKPTKETKTAPSPKKTGPNSEDRPVSGSSARSGRTTAGNNEKSSQQIDEEPSAGNGSGTRAPRVRKPAKLAAPAKKKAGRRGRKKATDEPMLIDKRPPAARGRGGRTTPPGTTRARGSKKKRRK
ncbi:MAG: YidC/Oxa1 family membrane protein insertase, partial [Acidimicrobiales bacterium]|nr:YidC/Oxa1 family membrane protein insertase [Acidimicrobiales bacterium]